MNAEELKNADSRLAELNEANQELMVKIREADEPISTARKALDDLVQETQQEMAEKRAELASLEALIQKRVGERKAKVEELEKRRNALVVERKRVKDEYSALYETVGIVKKEAARKAEAESVLIVNPEIVDSDDE